MDLNTTTDQFVIDDEETGRVWAVYCEARARIAAAQALPVAIQAGAGWKCSDEADADAQPSGMVAGFLFSVIWGAGWFGLGYLVRVWGGV